MSECCAPVLCGTDLVQLAAFGFLMSAGHCLGMCGPLVCAVAAARGKDTSRTGAVLDLGLHHAGRIASYAVLGLLVGALGGAALDISATRVPQALLAVLAAAALAWTGLGLLGVFPLASCSFTGRIARFVAGGAAGRTGRRTPARRFALGVANGLLPCGPVYTVAIAALAAGGAGRGALAMAAFGIGTVPLLAALALGTHFLRPRLRTSFVKVGAVLALAMGVQLGLRGMAGLEWVPHARLGEVVLW